MQPVFRADVVIAHLIADGQRVRALAADRLAQAYGVLDGFEREGDVLRRQLELSGDFLHGRLAPQLGLQAVARGERFIGDIPKRTADANGVVIPKIAPNLADNHRHGVGRKAHVLRHVKMIEGFD